MLEIVKTRGRLTLTAEPEARRALTSARDVGGLALHDEEPD
jgi:hypothetical protein